jgi:hypothetical protein
VRRVEVASNPDDNVFLEWADAARVGLTDYRQSEAFSQILDKNQDHNDTGMY